MATPKLHMGPPGSLLRAGAALASKCQLVKGLRPFFRPRLLPSTLQGRTGFLTHEIQKIADVLLTPHLPPVCYQGTPQLGLGRRTCPQTRIPGYTQREKVNPETRNATHPCKIMLLAAQIPIIKV